MSKDTKNTELVELHFGAPQEFADLVVQLVQVYNSKKRCKLATRLIEELKEGLDKWHAHHLKERIVGKREGTPRDIPTDWYTDAGDDDSVKH